MGKKRTLCILVLVLCWGSLGRGAEWRVGMARVGITPTQPLWMAGYAARNRPAEGTAQPLQAKALVIEDRQARRVVLVTADLIGDNFGRELGEAIARRVHRLTGIERERIVFNFSHTHCGLSGLDGYVHGRLRWGRQPSPARRIRIGQATWRIAGVGRRSCVGRIAASD